ncbi:MAG: hypothetical protein K0R47_1676 [Brevibacillus sp.]|nr:hypothetical protein [Brevibacillus sp.]
MFQELSQLPALYFFKLNYNGLVPDSHILNKGVFGCHDATSD